jgi:predicted nucleotidyltransferase
MAEQGNNSKIQTEEILKQAAAVIKSELKEGCRVFLFGSRAREICDEKSDIDIGILSDTSISGKQWMAIQEKLEQIPTLLKIDVVDFNTVDEGFKESALKHTRDLDK